jgi:hypothetical protein
MSKWDTFRGGVDRLHQDFQFPECVFSNYSRTGIDRGQPTGSYSEIGTIDCEFVPPGADSTVSTEGTHLDFSTSIRVPTDDLSELSESLVTYGEDGDKPTRVEAEGTTYEVQSVVPEHGSDMRLLRLTEP